MRVIVPLAGPDFIRDDGTLKAQINLGGEPLLRRVLTSRPWAEAVAAENHSFILLDAPETRAFATGPLDKWYPGASVTFLSCYTRGAALSALAGIATGADTAGPIIVDLADIMYSSTLDPATVFAANPDCGGIALTFKDDNPAYSYLRLDAFGVFSEAAEKRVISEHASAGTYMFRNLPIYLRALAHGLENEETQTFRNLFFVCPLFNGVKDQGKGVLLESVTDVTDIKVETS
ncbi:MAG: hypothetical protein ACJA0K_000640 [Maricaulis maris]|jgi:hypothetical protein|uniref:MobA-like NTP transferase domain-containing protein n=1 Tax=Maricaulis maris (strain MCS10) TaxID=394221 RepID=Q0ALT7_MARMM|nr:hypothetical protein [Maricaulis maris]ABI66756.1 hypothetical protein Mmar10_2465 [Maricaulis maris MCS10]